MDPSKKRMVKVMFKYNSVCIKAIEESDLSFLAECRNYPETWKYLGSVDFANEVKQKAWWQTSSLDKSKAYFVFCVYDHPLLTPITKIGFVRMDEIDHFNKSVRVGGDIHPDFRGKGYGTEMYKLLLEYCFNQLNMHRVWLFVLSFNKTAIELYHKMGFQIEGTQRKAVFRDGAYHDYLMLSILRNEYKHG